MAQNTTSQILGNRSAVSNFFARLLVVTVLSTTGCSVAIADDIGWSPDGDFVRLVANQPDPVVEPGPASPIPPLDTFASTGFDGLGSVPNMFGDFFAPPGQFMYFNDQTGQATRFVTDLPLGGALRRSKISDNNKALPTDRIYFSYNHFNNAVSTTSSPLPFMPVTTRQSVDRYLVGFEKTFFSGMVSAELRIPFASPTGVSILDPGGGFEMPGQDLGNLNLVIKALLHRNETWAAAIGVGIDMPTADDIAATIIPEPIPMPPPGPDPFLMRFKNEAVYLQPFFAIAAAPTANTFIHAFIEADIPTGGNGVTIQPFMPGAPEMPLGALNDPVLLQFDATFGRWLYRNPSRCGLINSVAGVVELHYITIPQDPDLLGADLGPAGMVTLGNLLGRQDFLDLTAGVHTVLGENTTLRVGMVAPVRNRPDRTFDSEFFMQLNHYFR